jgi:hypothetical protein
MKRFKQTELGYRYDKLIFIPAFLIIVFLVLLIMYNNSFDFNLHPYFNCKAEICENTFYNIKGECTQTLKILWVIPIYKTEDCRIGCEWCNSKFLLAGEYGSKPKSEFLLNNMYWIAFIIILLAMVLNHFINNRGKKFDIEISITKKLIINRRWLKEQNEKYKNNIQD